MAMDLSHLSEQEREAIMKVLLRDEELRKKETERVTKMKNELLGIRQKGALKSGLDPEYSCARCRTELGRVLNRGDPCSGCQGKVCKECRVYSPNNSQVWLCVVCFKQMELQAASGLWMNEFIRRPSRRRDHKVTTGDLVKSSIICRSWTSADGLQQPPDRTSVAVRDPHSLSSSSTVHIRHPQSSSPRGGPNQTRLPPLPPSSSSSRRSAPPVNERPPVLRTSQSMAESRMDSSANSGDSRTPRTSPGAFPGPPVTPRKTPSPTARTDSRLSSSPSPQHPDGELFAVRSTSGDISRSSPSPQHPSQQSPSPRSNRPIPSPVSRPESSGSVSPSPTPSPRQRSPLQKQRPVEPPERNMSNESQDSGYLTHSQVASSTVHRESHRVSEIFDSGYDNQGSPRTSRSSEHSRQSSGVSSSRTDSREPTGDSVSGSDISDPEDVDPTNEVVFRKIAKPLPKKRGTIHQDWHLNDARTYPTTSAVPPPWGQIGGAHSLPRTKARTVHSISMPFYQYSPSPADDNSAVGGSTWSSPNAFPQSLHVMGGSLTLPRRGIRSSEVWVTGSTTEFVSHEDLLSAQERSSGPSSLILRPLDGHRRTPTGSPVVKRIRRNRRESSTKGGRLRSPERFPGKENLPFDVRRSVDSPDGRMEECSDDDRRRGNIDSPTGSDHCRRLGKPVLSSSFEEIPLASLEFDDEIPIARSYNNDMYSDILLNVSNKIIPESDDYKLVFISSSSSKSSGLNSLDGSSGEASESSSRRVSSVVDESEMMVFVEESDWEGGGSRHNSLISDEAAQISNKSNEVMEHNVTRCMDRGDAAAQQVTVASSNDVLDVCTFPNVCLPATYQEIVESLSPTHSVDEVETDDHVLKPVSQSDVVSLKVSGELPSPSNISAVAGGSFYLGSCREAEECEQVRLRKHDWHPVTVDTASQINVTPGQLLGASYLEPPSGVTLANNNVRVTTHANRYFIRSDSARSSGERSMEEISYIDHVLPFPSSPQPSELDDDYKSILSEIRNYTSQSCDDVASFLSKSNPKSLPEPPPVYLRLSDWNDSLSSMNWLALSGTECSFYPQRQTLQGADIQQRNYPSHWSLPTPHSHNTWPRFPTDLPAVSPLHVTSALSTGDFSEIDTISSACTEASSVKERLDLESEGLAISPTSELCSSIVDASDEWEYRVGSGETSTMALQVNLSAETESHVDANLETQSVHCSVDDDTFSVGAFSEDGLGDGSPSVGKTDLLSSLLGSAPPMVERDDVTQSDKVCSDKILPHNSDYTVPLMQTDGVTDASSSNGSGDAPIATTIAPSLNALVSNDVSVTEEMVDLERRASQGSLSNADSTSEMGVMSLSSEGIEDEDEDFVSFTVKEVAILEEAGTETATPTEQSLLVGSGRDKVSTKKDYEHLNTDGETDKDVKAKSDVTSGTSTPVPVEARAASPQHLTDMANDDGSGNLVYYLGPQGTQSMYLVRTEKLGTTRSLEMDNGEQEASMSSEVEAEVIFSDDRTGSDTDSQDTVIEGESYKRMRQLAVQNKIIEANEELNSLDVDVDGNVGISESVCSNEVDKNVESTAQLESELKASTPSQITGNTEDEEAILSELMDSPMLGDLPSPMSRGSIDSDFPSSPPPPLPLSSPPLPGSSSGNDSSLQRAAETCAEAILQLVSNLDSAINVDVVSTVASDVNGNDVLERTGSYDEEVVMQADKSPAIKNEHEYFSINKKTMDVSSLILEAYKENVDDELSQLKPAAEDMHEIVASTTVAADTATSGSPCLTNLQNPKTCKDNTQPIEHTQTNGEMQDPAETNVELLSYKVLKADEDGDNILSAKIIPDISNSAIATRSETDSETTYNPALVENSASVATSVTCQTHENEIIEAINQSTRLEAMVRTRESFMESQLSVSTDMVSIVSQEDSEIVSKLFANVKTDTADSASSLPDGMLCFTAELQQEELGATEINSKGEVEDNESSDAELNAVDGFTNNINNAAEQISTSEVLPELTNDETKTGTDLYPQDVQDSNLLEKCSSVKATGESNDLDKSVTEPGREESETNETDPHGNKTTINQQQHTDASETVENDNDAIEIVEENSQSEAVVGDNVPSDNINSNIVCETVEQDETGKGIEIDDTVDQNIETSELMPKHGMNPSHDSRLDGEAAKLVIEGSDIAKQDCEASDSIEQDVATCETIKRAPEPSDTVKQDPEPSDTVKQDPETSDAVKQDPETSDAVKQDPETSDAVKQDPETSDTVKQDPEPSDTVKQDPETSDAVKQDLETSDAVKQDLETSDAVKQDLETSDAVKQDLETSDAVKQDPETSDAVKQDPETSDAVKQDPETSDAVKQNPETSDAVKQDPETSDAVKQDPETSDAVKQDPETSDAVKQDPETSDTVKQDPETSDTVKQDHEASDTVKQDPEARDTVKKDIETSDACKQDTDISESFEQGNETIKEDKAEDSITHDAEKSESANESNKSVTGSGDLPVGDTSQIAEKGIVSDVIDETMDSHNQVNQMDVIACADSKIDNAANAELDCLTSECTEGVPPTLTSKSELSNEDLKTEEEETETRLPSAVEVTSLQKLIENSRKLTEPRETSDASEESPSVLEQYYTCSLGASGSSSKARKMAVTNSDKGQGPLASYYQTLADKESEEEFSSIEVETSSGVPSDVVSSDNWDSEPSEWVDDSDTTFSDSASSDEANFDREEELRGFSRTIDFSLHTIIEESCEESESEREKMRAEKTPQPPEDPSDLEKYFNFTIGDTLLELQKRRSLAEDSEASDTYSETSGSVCSESVPSVGEDVDPATLASSRLEKYFMTGFLGLEHYAPFDDPYATDESGSVGSGSEVSSITGSSMNGSPHASRKKGDVTQVGPVFNVSTVRRKKASVPGGDGNASDGSSSTLSDTDDHPRASEEDSTDAPFDKNDGFDTIKRKKKTTEKQHKTSSAANVETKIDESTSACPEDPENCATPIAEPAEELLNSASLKPEETDSNKALDIDVPKVADQLVADALSSKTDADLPTDLLGKSLEETNIKKSPDIQCETVYSVETRLLAGGKTSSPEITNVLLSLKEEPEVSATPLPDSIVVPGTAIDITLLDKVKQCGLDRKQQSRDSGFIGSSDDLLKDSVDALEDSSSAAEEAALDSVKSIGSAVPLEVDLGMAPPEASKDEEQLLETTLQASSKKKLSIETSNSDDETRYIVGQLMEQITKNFSMRMNGSPLLPRAKPPELEAFEAELTKLMQTVPGIDATVKEIVEELSSTDYYSDSYESSDYTNSDVDGPTRLGFLRRSIRSSLRSNDDVGLHWSKDGATGLLVAQDNALNVGEQTTTEGGVLLGDLDDGLREDANSPFTRETIYIYDRLMTSLGKMAEQASKENSDSEHPGNQSPSSTRSHPSATLQAVQHIRDRLASLMREVHTCPSDGFASTGRVRRNNSSSSSSSWMGVAAPPRPHLETVATLRPTEVLEGSTTKPYTGSLHADITRWLAKQQFNSGDEQSISSTTSSTTYESEDSPTDTELSLDSDDMSTPAAILQRKDSKKGIASALAKRDRTGSDITVVNDDLSFHSLNTPETLFATQKIGAEANPLLLDARNKRFSESSLRQLKSLQERGVMDLQYFVTQGSNNEYEVWQSMVVDKDKFTVGEDGSNVAGARNENDARQILRARHLLDSLRSSSSDTLQCISEEDLDSKPSSSRTSVLGSSTNIWSSSQSSLADGKRGSLEALGVSETTQSPLPDRELNVMLRKGGLIAIDIPLSETETEVDSGAACSTSPSDSQQYRSSFHTEVLDSGTITNTKDKMDFRSSLHLWLESSGLGGQKSAPRAMSADPLPQDCSWSTPNLLYATRKSKSREINLGSAPRPRSMGINLSDNHLDRPVTHHQHTKYSTIAKSGPISMSPPRPPSFQDPSRPKASTLPRIGGDTLHANVSFLHKTPSSFMTNPPPPTAAPSSQSKWSRMPMDPQARREVQSWPAEEFAASIEPLSQPRSAAKRSCLKSAPPAPEGKGVPIPQISVSDITESHPSGRSSLCSHGNNSDRESMPEEDIDRLVAMHKTRSSLSSLGTRSDSMTSVYSAAGGGRYGTVVVRGEAFFSLSYNYKLGALEVHIKQCRDLASVDTKRSRSDPYVKVYLLPDKSKSGKRKTKVKKHTLNPVFDEVLRFNVTISELETRTLWLTVWHSDMFGRNDFLGEVMLPLGYEVFEDVSPKWYMLQERLGPPEEVMTYKGELTVALKFVPPDVTTQKKGKQAKGSLHVLVKEARNLTAVRANGTSDPFCKSYLLPDKGKVSKQKTHVIKKNCNPKWNHTFVYDDVNIDELHDRCLELTVWDYDRLTSNDFLGGVRLSLGTGRYQGKEVDWLDSSGEEIVMWQSMLERPNMWVDGTLLLQPTMEKRL